MLRHSFFHHGACHSYCWLPWGKAQSRHWFHCCAAQWNLCGFLCPWIGDENSKFLWWKPTANWQKWLILSSKQTVTKNKLRLKIIFRHCQTSSYDFGWVVAAFTSGPPCPTFPACLCFFLSLARSSRSSPLSVLPLSDGCWSAHLPYGEHIGYLELAPQEVSDTALHLGNPHSLLTMQTIQQPITHKLRYPVYRCLLPWTPLPYVDIVFYVCVVWYHGHYTCVVY